jgi:hypothetical protein
MSRQPGLASWSRAAIRSSSDPHASSCERIAVSARYALDHNVHQFTVKGVATLAFALLLAPLLVLLSVNAQMVTV